MRGLVADDEEGIRNVIREYLEFDGHTVAEAANGAEAVSLCRMQKFDFIVMAIMMPPAGRSEGAIRRCRC